METVVYQSFRTEDVPGWMSRCLETVRGWAAAKGFDYHFVDDRMFSYAPDWYRRKVGDNPLLVSYLARLEIARELLAGAYECAIWIDADVAVFDPAAFDIVTDSDYVFCRELAVREGRNGEIRSYQRINNVVCLFRRGNSVLDFYIHACQQIVTGARGRLQTDAAGTRFLTHLARVINIPAVLDVGLIGPPVLRDIAEGGGRFLDACGAALDRPIRAANLCGSYRGRRFRDTFEVTDDLYEAALDALLATRGGVVNDRIPPPQPVRGGGY